MQANAFPNSGNQRSPDALLQNCGAYLINGGFCPLILLEGWPGYISRLLFPLVLLFVAGISSAQIAPDADLYYRRTIGAGNLAPWCEFTNLPNHSREQSGPAVLTNEVPCFQTTEASARSLQAPLDSGVDPYNLGKGDWIWEMASCESALGLSTPQAVIDYEAGKGMNWVCVKAGDGTSKWSQWNSAIINEAHAQGMKIFAWVYVYGNSNGSSESEELALAKWADSVGGDGLIIDAEGEYEGQAAAASAYASGIKATYPTRFLAYAPFPYISYHSSFPYVQFGTYCDAVMPQDYWADLGISPSSMITDMDAEWATWQNSLVGSNTNAIKPIIPIGQGWNSSGYTEPASAITNFVYRLQNDPLPACAGGYHGVSFWSCQHHTTAVWAGLATSPILSGTTNRIVSRGSKTTFAVHLPVGGQFTYQWSFNHNAVAGATNASYTIDAPQSANAGIYSLLVRNSRGCTMHYSALLSVRSPLANLPGSVASPAGMVDWWPEEGNANDIYDTLNGTPHNGVNYIPGETGSAIHFDGETGFLKTDASRLPPPWTVCLWIKRQDAFGPSAALLSGQGPYVLKLEQYNSVRKVGVTIQGVADQSFAYVVPPNTWTHLAFVDHGTQIQLYANGVSRGALSCSFSLPRSYIGLDSVAKPDTIGSRTGRKFTDYMRGSLDEILVFDRALSSLEINRIYSAGRAGLVRAPEFTKIESATEGQVQLNLRGQTGKSFILYASTNFIDWASLGNIPNPTGTAYYLDDTTAVGQKFYRLAQP